MDEILVREYLMGRNEAMDMLIDMYKKPLYKFCFHLTKNNFDADDLFQETWIKVIKNIRRYNSGNFKGFLYKICINALRDQCRKNKRQKSKVSYLDDQSYTDRLEAAGAANCENIITGMERYNSMVMKLNAMKDHYRIPVILFYFEGMRYSMIAEVLDMSIGTVKSRIDKCRSKLREIPEVSYSVI